LALFVVGLFFVSCIADEGDDGDPEYEPADFFEYDSEDVADMTEEPPSKGITGETTNSFWILPNENGWYHTVRANIHQGKYGKMEIKPSVSGDIVIYDKYPDGHIEPFNKGYGSKGHKYITWFDADVKGYHTLWYRVDGGESSQEVKFYVY
jgi:hypothetical protein